LRRVTGILNDLHAPPAEMHGIAKSLGQHAPIRLAPWHVLHRAL
jgi:hypothetical protein